MKTLITLIAATFVSSFAQADVIQCHFTEPFYYLTIDTEAKTVTKTEPNWETDDSGTVTTLIAKNISIETLPADGEGDLVDWTKYVIHANGAPYLELTLDYQGSDGMSDFAYPYSTKDGPNWGGCDSDKLPTHAFHYENNN